MAKKSAGVNEAERGRWSARKKSEAVLRLLKGEDLDTLSRELKVNAATLSGWRDVFLENGLAGLKSRELDSRDERIAQLQKTLGTTTLRLEVAREVIEVYEESRSFSRWEVEAVRAAVSASRHERCGLSVVCEVTGVARSSVYAQRRPQSGAVSSVRRGPKT